MTFVKVVERERTRKWTSPTKSYPLPVEQSRLDSEAMYAKEQTIQAFEADPDFTLRDRLVAFRNETNAMTHGYCGMVSIRGEDLVRRLNELLGTMTPEILPQRFED